ncbi:MAG: NUDIX domain-containing protein [Solobacterium sp.]|nr:NUDIX domain-containing protein [Solobacterium sp.]
MTLMEKSCGAVVVRRRQGKVYTLMIRQNQGHWCFPKGHVEGEENEFETAEREVLEETGLKVRFIDGFRESVVYSPRDNVMKEAVYFLAEPCGGKEKKQDEEISEMHWADILEALALITYDNDAVLFRKAMRFLKNQEDE